MNKLGPILKDALILFLVSTAFVSSVNYAFSFLTEGASQNAPIVTAILQNDAGAVRKIAQDGTGAVRAGDATGRTPLMWVAYTNYDDPKRTADADKIRQTLVPMLIKAGADVNARDHDAWTPLMWASWSGMPGVAAKLLEAGALPNLADPRGNTALSLAVAEAKQHPGHVPAYSQIIAALQAAKPRG